MRVPATRSTSKASLPKEASPEPARSNVKGPPITSLNQGAARSTSSRRPVLGRSHCARGIPRADLGGANLTGADLLTADLTKANLIRRT